ncbi:MULTISPECIES: hypothetical protein [Microbacterium]|uniref:DUF4913 domain-containing protein n=1 Tax=Microbacterium wangchenii TaxID=2541726 RepID=A0ABX5SY94_9MICO|nr:MULTISPECIES: hypothetical protein [Microbacterium]MCK6065756.1 hypothetical protein [Microbacterium sp. EYE_512]QBR90073.1 hypothetical protein E4K62_16120 [Microbacterium wangchenii]
MNERERTPEEIGALMAAQLSGPPILTRPTEPTGVPPVDWRSLSADEARAAWTALRRWVEWFTVRYGVPVSVVPSCWWKHGALVEELSALHVFHQASFDKNDSGYGPLEWHERLTHAQSRLQHAGSGCTSGHYELKPRSWAGETDEAEWDAWIDQTHAD